MASATILTIFASLYWLFSVASAPTPMTAESCARISSCDECVQVKCGYVLGNPGQCVASRSGVGLAVDRSECTGIPKRAEKITLESRMNHQHAFHISATRVDVLWDQMQHHVLDGEANEGKDRNGRHLASTWIPKHLAKGDPHLKINPETSLAVAEYHDGTRMRSKTLWIDEQVQGVKDREPSVSAFHGKYSRSSVARICKDVIRTSLTTRKSNDLEYKTVCYSVESWHGGPNICIALTHETCYPAPTIAKTAVPAGHVCPCYVKP
ncbi:hypothetical protein FOMPIDRAFT_1026310 [Fomitopsis schrenkii]|uniref:Uncharacterized protein n=1 Tax=Fomitopsis schrenkii TaxID=2126942 RepID=S8DN88_FOMSC|nr:hypothetical protein FOMPIDRAFT_1026310 [Fomitopsis schrenkii]